MQLFLYYYVKEKEKKINVERKVQKEGNNQRTKKNISETGGGMVASYRICRILQQADKYVYSL